MPLLSRLLKVTTQSLGLHHHLIVELAPLTWPRYQGTSPFRSLNTLACLPSSPILTTGGVGSLHKLETLKNPDGYNTLMVFLNVYPPTHLRLNNVRTIGSTDDSRMARGPPSFTLGFHFRILLGPSLIAPLPLLVFTHFLCIRAGPSILMPSASLLNRLLIRLFGTPTLYPRCPLLLILPPDPLCRIMLLWTHLHTLLPLIPSQILWTL